MRRRYCDAARAGYDPLETDCVWKHMIAVGKNESPEKNDIGEERSRRQVDLLFLYAADRVAWSTIVRPC